MESGIAQVSGTKNSNHVGRKQNRQETFENSDNRRG